MRTSFALAAAVLGVGLVGCPNTKAIECFDQTSCGLTPGGVCVVAPSGSQWCAYPDLSCPGGLRYSDYDTGDGLSGNCVGDDGPDGGNVDASIDAPPGTWAVPMKLPFSRDRETEEHPSVSADGRELYFVGLGEIIGGHDIAVTFRAATTDAWGSGRFYPGATGDAEEEYGPHLDPNGTELLYERDGALWRITRANPWSTPLALGINGRFPDLSADGLTLYYFDPSASCPSGTCRSKRTRGDRLANWSLPMVEQMSSTVFEQAFVSGDLKRVLLTGSNGTIAVAFRATTASPWGPPQPIAELSGSVYNYARWNAAEDEMYLTRPGLKVGTYDVYQSKLER